jgi:hypothetical protein
MERTEYGDLRAGRKRPSPEAIQPLTFTLENQGLRALPDAVYYLHRYLP